MRKQTKKNSWEKQAKESDNDYELFLLFLDFKKPRNIMTFSLSINRPYMEVTTIAKANKWEDRCLSYDKYIRAEFEKRKMQEINRIAVASAAQEAELKNIASEISKESLIKHLINERDSLETKLKIADIERLINFAYKKDEVENEDGNNIDVSKLTDKEIELLNNLLAKAGK